MAEDPSKPTKGDYLHGMVKGGLSLVPGVGGAAAEVFGLLVKTPAAKRMETFLVRLSDELERIGVVVQDLSTREDVVSVAIQATQAAFRTHDEGKLEALKNAVLNAALGKVDSPELTSYFIGLVDTLTPLHLAILEFLENPRAYDQPSVAGSRYRTIPSSVSDVLERALPDLAGKREIYDVIGKDLYLRGLSNTDGFHTMMTEEGTKARRTSPVGQAFLRFIQSPQAGKS